jgi:streptogramin lyase
MLLETGPYDGGLLINVNFMCIFLMGRDCKQERPSSAARGCRVHSAMRVFALPGLLGILAALSGCGANMTSTGSGGSAQVAGKIMGGQQPITGSAIMLYAAGLGGQGTEATSLLTNPVVSDSSGDFSITNNYHCPTPTSQVYLVASGGNPGLSNNQTNSAILLMAAVGDCQNLGSASFVTVNEVTTVSAAWALSQFLGPQANVAASATNTVGLRDAFLTASSLANVVTGTAGGPQLTAGVTLESAKLNALANSISTCVNSDGTTLCTPLFNAATVGGVIPRTTLDAALAIVQNPGNQVANVFALAPSTPPFSGALGSAPHDWTMSITYTGGGLAAPAAVAVNSEGYAWVANTLGGAVTRIGPDASVQGYSDANLRESNGVAIDAHDNVWISNQQSYGGVNMDRGILVEFNSGGTDVSGTGYFAGGGVDYPYGIAAAPNGDLWVADYGNSEATLLSGSGTSLLQTANGSVQFTEGVAVDASNNAWFASDTAVTKVTPSGTVTHAACCSGAFAVALDPGGNVWVADSPASSVVELNASGTILQTLHAIGGINSPESIAVDGNGKVWTSNYHGLSISELSPGPSSVALSPSAGFGLDAGLNNAEGLTTDASGNLWVANTHVDAVTEFVGLAAPVATPRIGPPLKP